MYPETTGAVMDLTSNRQERGFVDVFLDVGVPPLPTEQTAGSSESSPATISQWDQVKNYRNHQVEYMSSLLTTWRDETSQVSAWSRYPFITLDPGPVAPIVLTSVIRNTVGLYGFGLWNDWLPTPLDSTGSFGTSYDPPRMAPK